MKIDSIVDMKELERLIADQYIARIFHTTKDLTMYTSTIKCLEEDFWTPETLMMRGFITTTDTDEIVARPRRKMFALNTPSLPETMQENLPDERPEITQLLDGVVGTYYVFDGVAAFATRSGFHNETAYWATRQLENAYEGKFVFPAKHTAIFDIIRHRHKTICTNDFEDIVLTGLVNNETGEELPWGQMSDYARINALRCSEMSRLSVEQLLHPEARVLSEPNKRGYMLTYDGGNDYPLQILVENSTYLSLKQTISNFTSRSVWFAMKDGQDFHKITKHMPKFFDEWVTMQEGCLRNNKQWSLESAKDVIKRLPPHLQPDKYNKHNALQRKELHTLFLRYRNLTPVLFTLHNGGDPEKVLWQAISPTTTSGSRCVFGDVC